MVVGEAADDADESRESVNLAAGGDREVVRVRGQLNAEQMSRVYMASPYMRWIALMWLAVVLISTLTSDSSLAVHLASLLFFTFTAWIALRVAMNWTSRRLTRRMVSDYEWVITPLEVTTTTPESTATIKWSAFSALTEFGDAVVLRLPGGGFMPMPRTSFTDGDVARIAQWATAHGVSTKGLRTGS